MPEPQRIQRKRTKGWRMPPGAVCVTRPGRYGNPFRSGDRAADVENFRLCVSEYPVPADRIRMWLKAGGNVATLIALASRAWWVKRDLGGRDLCCWCPLDQPCHADALLELANGKDGG